MALGYLLEGKGDRCIVLITLPPLCADCVEIMGASTFRSPKEDCILYTGNYTVNLQVQLLIESLLVFWNNHKGYKQHAPPSKFHRTRTRCVPDVSIQRIIQERHILTRQTRQFVSLTWRIIGRFAWTVWLSSDTVGLYSSAPNALIVTHKLCNRRGPIHNTT
jgi:hypothetical protein